MIYGVYSMFDQTAVQFGSVSLDTNDFTAARNFRFAVSESKNLQFIAKDIKLFRIADFDSDSGEIKAVVPAKFVANGSDWIEKV